VEILYYFSENCNYILVSVTRHVAVFDNEYILLFDAHCELNELFNKFVVLVNLADPKMKYK
jgi:hypothetical protein